MPKIYNIKSFLKYICFIPFYSILKRQEENYKSFIVNNLIESKKEYTNCNEFNSTINEEYDFFITGSDQVWNYKANDFDIAYLLPFVNTKKKIAYAVSLGASKISDSNNWNEYKKYIEDFKSISVRENNAKKWLEESTNKKVEICLDPTLLIDIQEYHDIEDEEYPKEKYIFWYCMIYNRKIAKKIEKIAKEKNLKVYVIDAKEWIRRRLFDFKIKLYSKSGPSAYLSLVKNAELVITSSFHGTVFCYLYKKNFWYINIHKSKQNDDRASFLLKQLKLEDRMISIEELLTKEISKKPIYVEGILNDKREKSILFLESNIE